MQSNGYPAWDVSKSTRTLRKLVIEKECFDLRKGRRVMAGQGRRSNHR